MTDIFWTFPAIMMASIVVGWAAEITAVHLSAGIALAVLAWLQCSPEFAVEASIAWGQNSHLALANLTGSLRLLMGLGWPMVFFIHWFTQRLNRKAVVREVRLPNAFAVEALALALPLVYFLIIYLKASWTATDGLILCSLYGFYFWMLNLERKHCKTLEAQVQPAAHEEEEGEPWVVRQILKRPHWVHILMMAVFFISGGVALWFTVHPFVESLKATAMHLGMSEFIFIQWVAPIASEFPEKVTAFGWARKAKRVPYAIINMLSSVTSQWTLLAGLVPLIFSLSAGRWTGIELTAFQRTELLLTMAQSALGVVFLADLRIRDFEAVGLFILWIAQLIMPETHGALTLIYGLWIVAECIRLALVKEEQDAWKQLKKLFKHSFQRTKNA